MHESCKICLENILKITVKLYMSIKRDGSCFHIGAQFDEVSTLSRPYMTAYDEDSVF